MDHGHNKVDPIFPEACDFAAKKHEMQRRKNEKETPYINHPLEVARFIAVFGGIESANILCAAVLHDVIEDTNTTYRELETDFGKSVADIVLEVTDDKKSSKIERKKKQIEKMKTASPEAKMVKIGDKISNVKSTLEDPPKNWGKAENIGYAVWSKKVVDACRDANPKLATVFDTIFKSLLEKYECPDLDVEKELENYYESLEK